MGTTLYGASSGTVSFSPGVSSGWNRTSSGLLTRQAVTSDSSSGASWWSGYVSATGLTAGGQWVYGPLAAQTISGSCTITVYGEAATYTNIYNAAAAIWVSQGATSSVRGTALSAGDTNTSNWTTSMQGYSQSMSLGSVSASAGDYLILEAGWDDPLYTNSESGAVGAGNSRTRFNFSGTISLQVAPTQKPTTLWIGQPQRRSL